MKSIEFGPLDLDSGFTPAPGKPEVSFKVLSDSLNHEEKSGLRTRIIRVEPGYTAVPHDHPYWEGLVILSGSFCEGDPNGEETRHVAPAFARRAPGHTHGPARTDELCFMVEVNWYDSDSG